MKTAKPSNLRPSTLLKNHKKPSNAYQAKKNIEKLTVGG